MRQPDSGKVSWWAPLQPSVVVPSHNSFQPWACSWVETSLARLFTTKISSAGEGSRFSVLIRILRQRISFPASFLLFPIECRSEEHTSELQSLMRISYAVFCL